VTFAAFSYAPARRIAVLPGFRFLPAVVKPEPLLRVISDIFFDDPGIGISDGMSFLITVSVEIKLKMRFGVYVLHAVSVPHYKNGEQRGAASQGEHGGTDGSGRRMVEKIDHRSGTPLVFIGKQADNLVTLEAA
jgi:hypothetical protein